MGAFVDRTGIVYGRWTVIERDPPKRWLCRCVCGKERSVQGGHLATGASISCGCSKQTHNRSKTQLYAAWRGMHSRCSRPADKSYAYYGGRGITVCRRWSKFENFLADMGERPEGTTLERRKNNKGYSPGNCYWATRAQQRANQRCITAARKDNLLGLLGVSKVGSRYLARATKNGAQVSIGRFDTAEAAHRAYCKFTGIKETK